MATLKSDTHHRHRAPCQLLCVLCGKNKATEHTEKYVGCQVISGQVDRVWGRDEVFDR